MLNKVGCLVSAVVLTGAMLLSSCSPAPSSPVAPPSDTKPYGSLIIGYRDFGSRAFVDPLNSTPGTFQFLSVPVFDSLIEITTDGQPRPGIAERWEISSDGKTHTFYIRKRVKFHDGSDLTGADVKFSIDRILAPMALHSDAPVWRAAISSVDLKDDYTVAIRMKTPQFQLLRGFGDLAGIPSVVPKKYVEEKGADYFAKFPMGSGSWKVVKWEPGVRLELEAVESHWRAVPKFKTVTLLLVPEEAARIAMLRTGELDMAVIAADSVPQVKSAGLHVLGYNGGYQNNTPIFYDLDHPEKYPLGDVRVRKALSSAVNRRELADALYGGYAEPAFTPSSVSPTAFFVDPNVLKPVPFDPESAKRLLAEAGYPSGFDTKIYDSGAADRLPLSLSGYWKKIGVNAEVLRMEWSAIQRLWTPKQTPEIWNNLAVSQGGAGFGFEKVAAVYHSKSSTYKNHKNGKLDELIEKFPTIADPLERKKVGLEAAVAAMNEYSNITYLYVNTIVAFGSKVGGLTPTLNVPTISVALETITHAK